MAAVEVCVVAWLAWVVVAGLLGVVWGGSGLVLGRFAHDLGEVLVGVWDIRDPKLSCWGSTSGTN